MRPTPTSRIRDNVAVLVPWHVILPPFSFGLVHYFLFNTWFERKTIFAIFEIFFINVEDCMYATAFSSQS